MGLYDMVLPYMADMTPQQLEATLSDCPLVILSHITFFSFNRLPLSA